MEEHAKGLAAAAAEDDGARGGALGGGGGSAASGKELETLKCLTYFKVDLRGKRRKT